MPMRTGSDVDCSKADLLTLLDHACSMQFALVIAAVFTGNMQVKFKQ